MRKRPINCPKSARLKWKWRRFARHIESCGEHGDGCLILCLDAHGGELNLHLGVFGCIDEELYAHVAERLGELDAYVKDYHAADIVVAGDGCLGALGGGDIEDGVVDVAVEEDVVALGEGEGLEWDEGEGVLHLSTHDIVAENYSKI